jgi:hypothetical protein
MDRDTERLLAQLLARDAQQLEERSQQEGVLAYLRRPLRRERPNERFLQNTLRSVQFNNRCAAREALQPALRARVAAAGLACIAPVPCEARQR